MNNQYSQLTLEEREKLSLLISKELSLRKIGSILGRSHQTLSRELKRNKKAGTQYIPCRAHEKAVKRMINQRRKAPLKNHEIYLYVRDKLRNDHWSPEIISGRIKIDKPHLSITPETIYRYIYGRGKQHKLFKFLTHHQKKRRIKSGRKIHQVKVVNRIPHAVSIDRRSKKANNRSQIGHFETDLMEGKRSNKTSLSVEVCRKTRYTKLTKVKNKSSQEKQKVLQNLIKTLESLKKSNQPVVRSFTVDGGPENTCHMEITNQNNIPVYFCHPYHSWEKGTVENMIGRIRYFIPKQTPINKISNNKIQWLENKLNNTPRKCLGWLTPNEVMIKEVNSYKFKRYLKQLEIQASGALHNRM
jgi:IS30 family transposase